VTKPGDAVAVVCVRTKTKSYGRVESVAGKTTVVRWVGVRLKFVNGKTRDGRYAL